MAGSDSQKQFLSLIRDFAAEKSDGERRIISFKKRIEELESELDATNSEVEKLKRFKETTDQELKGFEVELSMNESSNQTLEVRIALIQEEISKVGSDVVVLKNEEEALRDEFINHMVKFRAKIRDLDGDAFSNLQQQISCQKPSSGSADADLIDLEKNLSFIAALTATEEEECEKEQNVHYQLQQDMVDVRRRLELIEAIMKDSKELQSLTQQTSNMEEKCALFSEELQRKCICPTCHLDNSQALAELLQAK